MKITAQYIYDNYRLLVYKLSNSMSGRVQSGRSIIDADDIEQEIYLIFTKSPILFDESKGVPLGAFVAMRIRTVSIDAIRNLLGKRESLKSAHQRAKVSISNEEGAQSRFFEGKKQPDNELVDHICHGIPDNEQLVIRGIFEMGYSFADIAKNEGVTPSCVSHWVSSMRSNVRKRLSAIGIER